MPPPCRTRDPRLCARRHEIKNAGYNSREKRTAKRKTRERRGVVVVVVYGDLQERVALDACDVAVVARFGKCFTMDNSTCRVTKYIVIFSRTRLFEHLRINFDISDGIVLTSENVNLRESPWHDESDPLAAKFYEGSQTRLPVNLYPFIDGSLARLNSGRVTLQR